MARNARQNKLLELISEKAIETQEDLVEELRIAGFTVTQATVSRDIKELGLIKISADGKRQRYTKEKSDNTVTSKFTDMFKRAVISVDYAVNIVVVKTLSGSANIAGMLLDRLNNKSILGCVAGDDTVMVVMRDGNSAAAFCGEIRNLTN